MNYEEIDWKQIEDSWKEIAEDLGYCFCKTCYSWVKNFKQHYKTKKHGRNLVNSLN